MGLNKLKYNSDQPLSINNLNLTGPVSGVVSSTNGFIGNLTGNVVGTVTGDLRGGILNSSGNKVIAVSGIGSIGIGTTQSNYQTGIHGDVYVYGNAPSLAGSTLYIGGYPTHPQTNQDYLSTIYFNTNSSGNISYIQQRGSGYGPSGSLVVGGSLSGLRIDLASFNIPNTSRQNATRLRVEEILGDIQILNTTNTTSATTGALQVSGGVGVASDLYVRLRSYLVGSVGIGSTQPKTKLDVLGNANISGVVTATAYYGDGSQLSGLQYSVLTDVNSTGTISYTGRALSGIQTTQSSWKIRKTLYSSVGLVISVGVATDVAWSNRTSVVYS